MYALSEEDSSCAGGCHRRQTYITVKQSRERKNVGEEGDEEREKREEKGRKREWSEKSLGIAARLSDGPQRES